MEAGPAVAVAAALDAWAAVDVGGLGEAALRAELAVIERLRSRLEGLAAVRVAALGGRCGGDVAAALRAELGLSGREARRRVSTAAALGAMPALGGAWAAGDISGAHAEVVAREGAALDASAQARLVAAARTMPVDVLARHARLVAMAGAADDGAGAAAAQHAARTASIAVADTGMVVLRAELDGEGGTVLRNALDRLCDESWRAEHPEREATLGERVPYGRRLADALVELARRALDPTRAGPRGRARPAISVLVDHRTLTEGLHEAGVCISDWGEPLAAATVRRLACEADIVAVVLGAPGEVLDVGQSRRHPSAAQRAAVVARDRHCVFPGCDTPAPWCHTHHIIHWCHRGPTSVHNLVLLCSRHHHLVHEGGFTLTGKPGALVVRTPTGATYHPTRAGPAP